MQQYSERRTQLPPPTRLPKPRTFSRASSSNDAEVTPNAAKHASLIAALEKSPFTTALLDTALAFGSLSFRAVEKPPPPPQIACMRTCCRSLRRVLTGVALWQWWDRLSYAKRRVARSAALSLLLFVAFVCMALLLRSLPRWDEGGSVLTYSLLGCLTCVVAIRRAVRRWMNTARALQRYDPHRRRATAAKVACVLCEQTRTDVLCLESSGAFGRGLASVSVVCVPRVWRSLVLSTLLFGLFLLSEDVMRHQKDHAAHEAAASYTRTYTPVWLALGVAFFAVNAACSSRPEDDLSASRADVARRTIVRSTAGAFCLFLMLICLAEVLQHLPAPEGGWPASRSRSESSDPGSGSG